MQASILCVGDEILTGLVENTNTGYLAGRLCRAGIRVLEAAVVADQKKEITASLDRLLIKSDLVLITGGLGPTADDITREAVAGFLGRPLKQDEAWLAEIKKRFLARGYNMPGNNFKQAEVIEGALLLKNERGTAPGQFLKEGQKIISLLPGPPHEMQLIFEKQVLPLLKKELQAPYYMVRTLRCIGLGESNLEERIKQAGPWPYAPLSFIAKGYEVDLQLRAEGDKEEAEEELSAQEKLLKDILGPNIFAQEEETLPRVVLKLLEERGKTLALAESCTGGLLADTLTDQPGSSAVFLGSVVAYHPEAKVRLLGLEEKRLKEKGVVSEDTAKAMARGAKKVLDADYALGVTGIAGPDSDGSKKPVGLVYVGLATPEGEYFLKLERGGGRRAVKERAVQAALDLLRRHLTENRSC